MPIYKLIKAKDFLYTIYQKLGQVCQMNRYNNKTKLSNVVHKHFYKDTFDVVVISRHRFLLVNIQSTENIEFALRDFFP